MMLSANNGWSYQKINARSNSTYAKQRGWYKDLKEKNPIYNGEA